MAQLILLPNEEKETRVAAMAAKMRQAGINISLIADNANKYYFTGRVFTGWISISSEGQLRAFVRRPVDLEGPEVTFVRKHEEIEFGKDYPQVVGLEYGTLCVAEFNRLNKHLRSTAERLGLQAASTANVSDIIRAVRAVKTPYELEKIAESGRRQTAAYALVPSLYSAGMTDLQLQIEIERALRLAGCLGQFRIYGDSMELFMANILAGDNADNITPYDFAMGGAGTDPSLPVGANNTVIEPGMTVMVDANGNFTGYMTDMTRTFALGSIATEALRAHQCSIDICNRLAQMGVPGTAAADLYHEACTMAAEAGLDKYFMGHRQQAGFVGHGLGIEINEAPVIAPRSRDILQQGNVIALEPKFVIPGTGAVGIENTYVVTDTGMVALTSAPEEILPLCTACDEENGEQGT